MLIKYRPQSLFAKLLAAHLAVIMITMVAIGFLFSYLIDRYFFTAREWELTSETQKVAEMLATEFKLGNYEQVQKMSQTLAQSMDIKTRVINSQKKDIVIAIPQEGYFEPSMDLEPNEIDYVLQGDILSKKVYGKALQHLLVAIPIFQEEIRDDTHTPEVIGAIIVSAPLTSIKATIAQISRLVAYSLFFATIVAGLFAFSLAKSISRPLQAITQAALDMKKGKFRSRIEVNDKGELGQLAATFNQAAEEMDKTLQEQNRLQDLRQNLVASVSHEFRAPLTSIQGFVDAMLEGFIRDDEKEKYLEIILSNTVHLKRLVDDLLELASIESGYVQLQWEEVCPYSLAEKAMNTVLPQAREKNITLKHKQEDNLPMIRGDSNRLYQVIVNLLENAIAYTPDGGTIVLGSKSSGDKVVFTVCDNGIGIPPEEIPYIWDRFYKVDKSRNRANKGKGLGLAIVRELVLLHHGQVDVDSIPGKESTFTVILPTLSSEDSA